MTRPKEVAAALPKCPECDSQRMEVTVNKISLSALRRLHEAATPGPWVDMSTSDEVRPICSVDSEICCDPEGDDRESDRALIAAMRNALPALIDIAEAVIADRAAQEAVSMACLDDMDSDRAQEAFQRGHDADLAMTAALARVEE